ncbi:helix-turn-helix domain-containing protein [Rubrobacter indicoceani]|uniref:helix-turn-helix transcriptional regulator n=1 Tax=Rubrobacter indicoceani TaxID=2051957 RepID=UPI000E5A7873
METTQIQRRYLSYAESEDYTGLHRVTLWRAVRDGLLKKSGTGRAVKFRLEDLDRFMSGETEEE